MLLGGVDGGVDAGDGGDALDGLSGGSVADSHGVLSREARGPWYGRVQRVGDGFSEMNLAAGVALGIGQATGLGGVGEAEHVTGADVLFAEPKKIVRVLARFQWFKAGVLQRPVDVQLTGLERHLGGGPVVGLGARAHLDPDQLPRVPATIIGHVEAVAAGVPVVVGGVTIHPDEIVFGDSDGVVIMACDGLDAVIEKAKAIRDWEERLRVGQKQGLPPDQLLEQAGQKP